MFDIIDDQICFEKEGNNYLKPKREAALQVLNTNFVGVMMTCPVSGGRLYV